ncbi:MAG: PcfB family protein [Lachnospiraceae bacterium]|nr:PcfB family protein [Lachnospiraceae bacterium]
MAEEIQEAVQIIRVAYEGIEIALRIGSGGLRAAQRVVEALIGLLEYEQTMGKTSMKKLLMKGGDLQVFQFKTEEAKEVKKLLKKYGVLYSELPDINTKDGMSEIIFHAEAVPRINMILKKLSQGRVGTFDEYIHKGDMENYDKLMKFLQGQKRGNVLTHTEEELLADTVLDSLIHKVGVFATEKEEISVEDIEKQFALDKKEAGTMLEQLEVMGALEPKSKKNPGVYSVKMNKVDFEKKLASYLALCERAKMAEIAQKSEMLDITISDIMIAESTQDKVKTRVPGTYGGNVRFLWTDKNDIMEIHGGKTLLTFLDPEKDYDLYDETGMVAEVKKGKDLYEKHYDRVESSVREHYEKLKNMPSEWLPHMDLKEVRKRG